MHHGRTWSRPVASAMLLLACGGALAAPPAGGGGAGAGFELELEGWWVAPRDLDLAFAFVDEIGGLSGGGDLQRVSPPREGVPRVRAAWVFERHGEPSAGVAFWEYDASGSGDTGLRPASVGALLASPDFAIGRSLVDRATARTRLRATQVDADFAWTALGGDAAFLGFAVGVRLFRFEQQTTVTYEADSFGTRLEEIVNGSSDADGVGPHAAVRFGYDVGRVRIGGEIGLALPIGDLEGTATDSAFVDGSLDRSTVVRDPGSRRTFGQLDGSFRLDVRITRRLHASVAYLYTRWEEVARTQRFVDDVSQNTTLPAAESVVFEGASAGLRFRF